MNTSSIEAIFHRVYVIITYWTQLSFFQVSFLFFVSFASVLQPKHTGQHSPSGIPIQEQCSEIVLLDQKWLWLNWSSPGNFGQSIPLHCATPLMHLQDAHDAENHSSPSSWIFPSLLHSFVYKISNHLEGFLFPNKLLPSAAHPHRRSNHRSIFLAIQFLCSRFLASDHRDKSLGDIRRLGIGN